MQEFGYQYVKPSGAGKRRQRGYWRRLAKTAGDPTILQARQRLRMSCLSNKFHGAKGVAELADGRRIPVNAALISPLLRGSPTLLSPSQEEVQGPPSVPVAAAPRKVRSVPAISSSNLSTY